MKIPIINRLWSERSFQPGQSAIETYEVSGVVSDSDAIAAVGKDFGASHEQDARLKIPIGGIGVTQPSPNIYKVRLSYATDSFTIAGNPLDEPADILPQFSRTSEAIDRDYQGNPIVNSAREPFSGGVQSEVCSLLITIAQYESSYDAQKIIAFSSPHPTLNEDAVTIPRLGTFQPHQLLFLNAQMDVSFRAKSIDASQPYVRMIYQLEARGFRYFKNGDYVSGFARHALDQGRQGIYGKTGGDLAVGPIVFGEKNADGQWEAVPDDVRLDGYGGVFDYPAHYVKSGDDSQDTYGDPPPGSVIEETPTGVFLYYLVNKPMPFAGIGFKFA